MTSSPSPAPSSAPGSNAGSKPRSGGLLGFTLFAAVLALGAALIFDLGGLGTRLLSMDASPHPARAPLAVKPIQLAATPAVALTPVWYLDASGYDGAELERQGARTSLVLYFKKQRCDDCRRFEHEILDAPEVKKFLTGVVKVRVDLESGERERVLAKRFGVEGAPALVVVPQSGPPRVIPLHPAGARSALTSAQLVAYLR